MTQVNSDVSYGKQSKQESIIALGRESDERSRDESRRSEGRRSIAVIGSKGMPSRVSGLEVYVQEICTALARDYDITVFCRKRYCDVLTNAYEGVRVVHVSSINTKHLDAITYSLFATLRALTEGYDLFWYQALGPAITAYLPRIAGKNVLSTVHGLDWKREKFGKLASAVLKAGEHAIVRCADEIIVLNNSDRLHFLQQWNRESHLINNGVDIPKRNRLHDAADRFALQDKGYIFFASRLVPEKNVHILIEAYNYLTTDKKLVIAGSGVHTSSYVESLYDLAAGNENVVFVGHVQGDMLSELYSNAYCYVLPSTIEGQSIGLLEAMSYGLPCIASDIPENRETAHGEAVYFEPGNALELAACLQVLIDDPNSAKLLGENALSTVKCEHDKTAMIRETETVIEQCMKHIRRFSAAAFRPIPNEARLSERTSSWS